MKQPNQQPSKQKPNTPQKYGYAHKVIPIRKRIWQKVLIRWGVLIAVGLVFIAFGVMAKPMFRNYPQGYELSKWLTGFVYLFIFLSSRVLPLTFSKEWTGIVRDRQVKTYTKRSMSPFSGVDDRKLAMLLSTRCVWTVECEDGDIEKVPIDTEEIWERYFEIGEKVRMYKNAKVLVKAHPPRDDENLMCPLCGVMVMEPICRKCGVDFTEAEESAAEEAQE